MWVDALARWPKGLRVAPVLACALASPSLARAETPASDLDDAEAVFRLGTDSDRASLPPAHDAFTYGAHLDFAFTALGGEPRTHLAFEPITRPRLGTLYDFRTDELLQPMPSRTYPSARVTLSGEWEAVDWLLFRGLVDSGQIRAGSTLDPPLDGVTVGGSPARDAFESLDPLRELSVVLGKRAATIELGRFRTSLADGLVYDGFGLGARARLNFDALKRLPLRAELVGAGLSDRLSESADNPLIALRLTHELSLFETMSVFGAAVWDRNGAMSDVVRSAFAERVLDQPLLLNALFANERGEAAFFYAGADTQLVPADGLMLHGAFAVVTGQFRVNVGGALGTDERRVAIDVLGAAASAELRYELGLGFELAGYAFLLSGDGPPVQGESYHAFISPAPYWVWTGLFFSGGLNQSVFDDRAALGGIHGHGVAGGGPGISFIARPIVLDLRAIWLQALAAPPPAPWGGGGYSYGLELDARAQWTLLPWLELGSELDVLFPANYFANRRVGYRALAIASFRHEH